MGRSILNATTEAGVTPNLLGIYYLQDDGVYQFSGSTNGTFGHIRKSSAGTNYWGAWTGGNGYTIKETGSYLRLRFSTTSDHATTWRAGNAMIMFSTDNWSNGTDIMGFGITSYNSSFHNFGDSGCVEKTWLHGLSAGTVIKFGLTDSAHNQGECRLYANVNASGNDFEDATPNSFGTNWSMNLKVEEIKASAVAAMSNQNTFATGA